MDEVLLHVVQVAQGVEQLAPDGGLHLGEVGRDDLVERPPRDPAGDPACQVGGRRRDVDGADRVVVRVARQVLPDLGLEPRLVGDLDAETYAKPAVRPARGGIPHLPLALGERGEGIGLVARVEVHVVGDRDLRDPPRHGRRAVDVDGDVAVGREVRVEVRVERQVAVRLGPGGGKRGRRLQGGRSQGGRRSHRDRLVRCAHPAISPSSRPTRPNASRQMSSSSSEWAAVTMVRSRAPSSATVG